MGYGLLQYEGTSIRTCHADSLRMRPIKELLERYSSIWNCVTELITTYKPSVLAIEEPFFGENVQSMLKLGRAQGIVMAAAIQADLPIYQYTPRKVKQAVAGNGNASKTQLAGMLAHLMPSITLPDDTDATDAVAVAVCHFLQNNLTHLGSAKRSGGWAAFVNDNPNRVR